MEQKRNLDYFLKFNAHHKSVYTVYSRHVECGNKSSLKKCTSFTHPINFTQILHITSTKPCNINTFRPISTPTTGIIRLKQVYFKSDKTLTNVDILMFVGVFLVCVKKAGCEINLHIFYARFF